MIWHKAQSHANCKPGDSISMARSFLMVVLYTVAGQAWSSIIIYSNFESPYARPRLN